MIGSTSKSPTTQILAAAERREIGKPCDPGTPEHAAMMANIAPEPGVMLLFKTKSDVERLIDTLQRLLAEFPKSPEDGGR